MIRKSFVMWGFPFIALVAFCLAPSPAAARPQQDQNSAKTSYTIPEYNAFQAAAAEKSPQARVKLLDDFVSKFPSSTLMQYVDKLYMTTYVEMKDYPKTIDAADKLIALGDKVDPGTRLQALQTRVQFFPYAFNPKAADADRKSVV